MGMGYGSNFAEVIPYEEVKKLCPIEAAALDAVLAKYGVEQQALAECFKWDEPRIYYLETAIEEARPKEVFADIEEGVSRWAGVDQIIAVITTAFGALKAAFAKATTVGKSCLSLGIGYHDEDDGDRYDEVTGVYWHVDGLYQLSPAGKKFSNTVERQFFVTFG